MSQRGRRRRPWSRSLINAGRALAAALTVGLAVPEGHAAELTFNTYGDINYGVVRQGSTSNGFSAPRLELFTSATQDKLAFLAETMFEVGDDNSFGVDMERIEVAYLFADWFRLRAGRVHTAIGYYNDAYHHGRYFQTTVDRPAMVRFEDEGGLIPAHSVGLQADGRFHLGGAGALRYDFSIANGRGRTPGEVTNLVDPNNGKMFNLRLRFEPRFLEGLIVGVNALVDSISASDQAAIPTITFVREIILGGHIVYLENNVHIIGEYLRVSHRANGETGVTNAFFLELGYTFNRVTPYLRGERVSFPATLDPFYAQNVFALSRGSFTSGLAGVRFTASDYLALKLEAELVHPEIGTDIKMVVAQCAFAF